MKLSCNFFVPAFTLWELVIVMLITSLIVSLSYGAYWIFAEVLHKEEDHEDRIQELMLIERELYRMTQSCESITMEGDQLYFNFIWGYSFLEFSDSTLTVVSEVGSEREFSIMEWNVQYLNERTRYLKSYRIRCKAGNQIYNLIFRKNYSNLFLYSF